MDNEYYERLAEEYKKSKEAIDALTKRQQAMRAELIEALQKNGYEDDKGHMWWKLAGMDIKYERRVTRTFDAASAEAWAKENELWDRLKVIVEQLDEDKLLALAWEDADVSDIITGFYGEKESWALKV